MADVCVFIRGEIKCISGEIDKLHLVPNKLLASPKQVSRVIDLEIIARAFPGYRHYPTTRVRLFFLAGVLRDLDFR